MWDAFIRPDSDTVPTASPNENPIESPISEEIQQATSDSFDYFETPGINLDGWVNNGNPCIIQNTTPIDEITVVPSGTHGTYNGISRVRVRRGRATTTSTSATDSPIITAVQYYLDSINDGLQNTEDIIDPFPF